MFDAGGAARIVFLFPSALLYLDVTMILYLGVMAAVLAAVYNMWLFDRLVRWEYEHQREQWERDGKPSGCFWRAVECTFWSSSTAAKQVGFAWLFKTPRWIGESSECRRWLFQMRVIALISCLAVGALISPLHPLQSWYKVLHG